MLLRAMLARLFIHFCCHERMKENSPDLKDMLLVDFDPLRCFIGDLEEEFPNAFKLWYDSLGGDAIGMMWERSSSRKRGRS